MTDIKFLLRCVCTEEAAIDLDSPLEAVLAKVMGAHFLGVDVLRGRLGVGHRSLLHTNGLIGNSYALVVDIVGQEKRLRSFASRSETRAGIGPIALTPAEALLIDEQQQVSA